MALTISEDWIRERVQLKHNNLEDVRSLSLPGTYHEKITSLGGALRHFTRLKHLDLSRNAIESLEGLDSLKMLEKLNLYYNSIPSLDELYRLRHNQALLELDLRLNPVARNEPDYRLFLIHMLPSLRRLDDRAVRDSERKAALMHFSSDQAAELSEHPRVNVAPPLKPPEPRVEHVKTLAKPPTVLEDDDAQLLDTIAKSMGNFGQLTGSTAKTPHMEKYTAETVRHMDRAGIGLGDPEPPGGCLSSAPTKSAASMHTYNMSTGVHARPSEPPQYSTAVADGHQPSTVESFQAKYPNIPITKANQMTPGTHPSDQMYTLGDNQEHATKSAGKNTRSSPTEPAVQFADDHLKFQDELEAYTSYKAKGHFTPGLEDEIMPQRASITGKRGNPHYSAELNRLALEEEIVPQTARVTGDKGNPYHIAELNRLGQAPSQPESFPRDHITSYQSAAPVNSAPPTSLHTVHSEARTEGDWEKPFRAAELYAADSYGTSKQALVEPMEPHLSLNGSLPSAEYAGVSQFRRDRHVDSDSDHRQRELPNNWLKHDTGYADSDPVVKISDLCDKYWNGAKSLSRNKKFATQIYSLLQQQETSFQSSHPSVRETSAAEVDRRTRKLEEDVRRLKEENAQLREKALTATPEIDNADDSKMKSMLIRAQRDLTILRSRLQQSMEDNKRLQESVIDMECRQSRVAQVNQSTAGDAQLMDKLRQENSQLHTSIAELDQRLQKYSQMEELTSMLQESHKTLMNTNAHLVQEIEAMKMLGHAPPPSAIQQAHLAGPRSHQEASSSKKYTSYQLPKLPTYYPSSPITGSS